MTNFSNLNMYSPCPSPWTSFLKKNSELEQDPYALYKDAVSLMLEEDILKIKNQLMQAHSDYTRDVALKVAICLMMERLLALQNEHVPSAMDSMVMSLFLDMPSLQKFRTEIINQSQLEAERKRKRGFWSKLFG